MPKCNQCRAIQPGNRDAAGHDSLDYIKGTELTFAQMPVKVTFYKCNDCGTRWYNQKDPTDPGVGWIPLN